MPQAPITGVEDWLRQLASEQRLPQSAHLTIQAIVENPQSAAYASAQDLAETAGLNTASVTRAAQALGFDGWPQLRLEIRSRYLNGLSASEMGRVHSGNDANRPPAEMSLAVSLDSIQTLHRVLDRKNIKTIAAAIAGARQTVVIASGSFAGVGRAFAHNGQLAGYPIQFHSEDSAIAAAMALLTAKDLVIVISFWRLYRTSVQAAEYAKRTGCKVLAISDSVDNALTRLADLKLIVPSESASHFPSLVGAQAAIEATLSELAHIEPDRSSATLTQAESVWEIMEVLEHSKKS